jgi:hypothetical protein
MPETSLHHETDAESFENEDIREILDKEYTFNLGKIYKKDEAENEKDITPIWSKQSISFHLRGLLLEKKPYTEGDYQIKLERKNIGLNVVITLPGGEKREVGLTEFLVANDIPTPDAMQIFELTNERN